MAQDENWDVYMAQYPKGPGSTVLNMQLKGEAPFKAYPYLLKTGVAFTGCRDDGMPTETMFSALYAIADSVKSVLGSRSTILAGSFTYQCSRYDYYYIKDTSGIRQHNVKPSNFFRHSGHKQFS